ncbi:hypothetical protein N7493_007270 [Penicillium malachiteum]|uniref:Class I SAM-dependent methyltransferase n=1 Tax=Penicillium malachiteum TaxID=1324776 RepID=A0AAD6HIX1_9EURO|nr:hypothetical protein N7493_007270 [Penicillium malachiteum]
MIENIPDYAHLTSQYSPLSWYSLVTTPSWPWSPHYPGISDTRFIGVPDWSIFNFSFPSLWTYPSHHSLDQSYGIAAPSSREFFELPGTPTVPFRDTQLHDTGIFQRGWPDQANDTVCGWGSSEQHTRQVRKMLTEILDDYNVKTLSDAGCGDLAWISMIDIGDIDYVGYDLYERATWPELREGGVKLDVLDITTQDTRAADLLICRDVLIHLPNDMVLYTLDRFRRSASLLLATSYTGDLNPYGGEFSNLKRMEEPSLRHAKLDLSLPPFNLGQPLIKISEDFPGKYLGLWNLSRLEM